LIVRNGNHQSKFSPQLPDPSVAEPKAIMLRRKGPFYACKDGAAARRFNRILINAGVIHGL
jgi:hypothetical protein